MTGQSLRHFNTVPVFWHNNLNYHHQMEQEWQHIVLTIP